MRSLIGWAPAGWRSLSRPDTKLDREVAIKVLTAAFAQHPEMLARFEREDKVLASLDHRNIAIIYADEEALGQLSPDSQWMAFKSDRSGRREVYVRRFPPGEGEQIIRDK